MSQTVVREEFHVRDLNAGTVTAYRTRDLALQGAPATGPISLTKRVIADTVEGVFGGTGLPPLPKSGQALIQTETVPTGHPTEIVQAVIG